MLQAYPAKGWVDGYNTQHIWGWACDPDYPTQSNRVDVYTTPGRASAAPAPSAPPAPPSTASASAARRTTSTSTRAAGIPSGTHFNVWSIDLPYATPGNDNRKTGGTGSIGDGTEFVIP